MKKFRKIFFEQKKVQSKTDNTSNINRNKIIQNEDNLLVEKFNTLHLNIPFKIEKSIRIYEKNPNEAKKFLDYMGYNFRWSVSMPDNIRSQIFWVFTNDNAQEDDKEHSLNCIYFYDNLDKGLFNEHKDEWVMIYKQKIIKYGKEYTNQQLADLDEKMPGIVYLPVDPLLREKIVNPKVLPARAVYFNYSDDGKEYMI
ncbi:hypothetical protein Glove_284g95 [Diversispora epigaea]|uniref:Uncharacterized protein n=1 Tax=Diversispora epigaea TaxID=1348612 RepID=A0A397I546_9GLOM|nr:hypothetical protein Glove_284g95 [Diversispora epigaea]